MKNAKRNEIGRFVNEGKNSYSKEYIKEYREKNRDIFRKAQKKYADKHREYYRDKTIEHNKKKQESGYHKNKQKEYRRKYPEKIKAHHLINNNKLKGDFCKKCGSKAKLEAHHLDYSRPKHIITLCRIHHNEIHRK